MRHPGSLSISLFSLPLPLPLILQNGGEGYDSIEAIVMDQQDGSVILAGAVDAGVTDYDFSIIKLDADGLLLWEYEVNFAMSGCSHP